MSDKTARRIGGYATGWVGATVSENRSPSATLLWRFATNLKRLRSSRSYTQHQLAARCGFKPGYVGDLEREVVNLTLATPRSARYRAGLLGTGLLRAPQRPTESAR